MLPCDEQKNLMNWRIASTLDNRMRINCRMDCSAVQLEHSWAFLSVASHRYFLVLCKHHMNSADNLHKKCADKCYTAGIGSLSGPGAGGSLCFRSSMLCWSSWLVVSKFAFWNNPQVLSGVGLGFRDLHVFNIAMLARQAWRFLLFSDTLCALVFNAKCFAGKTILQAKAKAGISHTWCGILKRGSIVKT